MSDDKVVPFQRPEKEESHLTGLAKCLSCKHEWMAVVPKGTVWLDCPACELSQGRMKGQVEYEGDHWHCKCGNSYFCIQPTRTYCPCCGVTCEFK